MPLSWLSFSLVGRCPVLDIRPFLAFGRPKRVTGASPACMLAEAQKWMPRHGIARSKERCVSILLAVVKTALYAILLYPAAGVEPGLWNPKLRV